MEIRVADGDRVLLFLTGSAQSATEPKQTELIFDRFGDQYFLSEISTQGTALEHRYRSRAWSAAWREKSRQSKLASLLETRNQCDEVGALFLRRRACGTKQLAGAEWRIAQNKSAACPVLIRPSGFPIHFVLSIV